MFVAVSPDAVNEAADADACAARTAATAAAAILLNPVARAAAAAAAAVRSAAAAEAAAVRAAADAAARAAAAAAAQAAADAAAAAKAVADAAAAAKAVADAAAAARAPVVVTTPAGVQAPVVAPAPAGVQAPVVAPAPAKAPVLVPLPRLVLRAPSAPVIGIPVPKDRSAIVRWRAPNNGNSKITGYSVRVVNAKTNRTVGVLRRATGSATSLKVTGLVNGTMVKFQVRAVNAVGTGAFSARSRAVQPAAVPRAPAIRLATSGVPGGKIDATARWIAPSFTAGSPITGYVVLALRIDRNGRMAGVTTSAVQRPGVRLLRMQLARGEYRFVVKTRNASGLSVNSVRSNLVRAR